MTDKPIIKSTKARIIHVVVQYVFKANFNDSYWLEELTINLDDLDKDKLTWFDPFNKRSKFNDTLVALAYLSDKKFVILEKKNGVIKESTHVIYSDCILCEDYNESMLLASHISIRC